MNLELLKTLREKANAGRRKADRVSLLTLADAGFSSGLFDWDDLHFWPAANRFVGLCGMPGFATVNTSAHARIFSRKEEKNTGEEQVIEGVFLHHEGEEVSISTRWQADKAPADDIFLGWAVTGNGNAQNWADKVLLPRFKPLLALNSAWKRTAPKSTYLATTGRAWGEKEGEYATISGFGLEDIFGRHAFRIDDCLNNLFDEWCPERLPYGELLQRASNPFPKQLCFFDLAEEEVRQGARLMKLKPVYEPCRFRDEREWFRISAWRTHWIAEVLRLYRDAGLFKRPKMKPVEELFADMAKAFADEKQSA